MELKNIQGIGEKTIENLNKININTIEDLIEYYPYNFASEEVNGVPYSCKFEVQFTPAA